MRAAMVWVAAGLLAACREPPADQAGGSAPTGTTPAAPAAAAATATAVPGPSAPEPADHAHIERPSVACPAAIGEAVDAEARVTILVDEANRQIEQAAYAAAWTCADQAADLSIASVEAHHLRGVALAALGRHGEAQLAFSLALSLDPDDPETLRAVADFYINGKRDRSRDAIRLGLELAQRGSRRAQARRRRNPPLAADLAVLEAQALNDLGRSSEALARIDAALRIAPSRGDALHEKGVALFDLSRFGDAKAALSRALEIQPEDPFSHQMIGLVFEQLGDEAAAGAALARARALAPLEIAEPVVVSVAEFQREIDAVVTGLPDPQRARVRSIKVEINDLPDPKDLAAVDPPFPPTILGLYRGPIGKAARLPPAPGEELPSIVLYRRNLARAVKTRAELSAQIRDTLLHEIGHLEGLDEDDLRRRGME